MKDEKKKGGVQIRPSFFKFIFPRGDEYKLVYSGKERQYPETMT
jgi:hypothetical protein